MSFNHDEFSSKTTIRKEINQRLTGLMFQENFLDEYKIIRSQSML
jgi:hypothetical protein